MALTSAFGSVGKKLDRSFVGGESLISCEGLFGGRQQGAFIIALSNSPVLSVLHAGHRSVQEFAADRGEPFVVGDFIVDLSRNTNPQFTSQDCYSGCNAMFLA